MPELNRAGSSADLEVELKFQVYSADVNDLLVHDLLQHSSTTKTIRSVYFDTPTHEVRVAGFSLRVRHIDERRIQTIKADSRSTGLFQRCEWTSLLNGDVPEAVALAGTPLAALQPANLCPVFEVEVIRTSAIYDDGQGGKVEIAFDQGWVRGRGRATALCEIEFEVKGGPLGTVFDLARLIAKTIPLIPSTGSKADVGYNLIDSTPDQAKSDIVIGSRPSNEQTRRDRVTASIMAIAAMETALHN